MVPLRCKRFPYGGSARVAMANTRAAPIELVHRRHCRVCGLAPNTPGRPVAGDGCGCGARTCSVKKSSGCFRYHSSSGIMLSPARYLPLLPTSPHERPPPWYAHVAESRMYDRICGAGRGGVKRNVRRRGALRPWRLCGRQPKALARTSPKPLRSSTGFAHKIAHSTAS
eukprot:scaffold3299_cov116-Isochrysis_galbana.AAC.12